MICKSDGTRYTTQVDIENMVLDYFEELMGKQAENLNHIDVEAMQSGSQL